MCIMKRGRKPGGGRQQPLAPTDLKYCPMCDSQKQAKLFGLAASRADGRMGYCKACLHARDKKRHALTKIAVELLNELVQATAVAPWNYDEIERLLTYWKTQSQ